MTRLPQSSTRLPLNVNQSGANEPADPFWHKLLDEINALSRMASELQLSCKARIGASGTGAKNGNLLIAWGRLGAAVSELKKAADAASHLIEKAPPDDVCSKCRESRRQDSQQAKPMGG
jgi:hypothetical protein